MNHIKAFFELLYIAFTDSSILYPICEFILSIIAIIIGCKFVKSINDSDVHAISFGICELFIFIGMISIFYINIY